MLDKIVFHWEQEKRSPKLATVELIANPLVALVFLASPAEDSRDRGHIYGIRHLVVLADRPIADLMM